MTPRPSNIPRHVALACVAAMGLAFAASARADPEARTPEEGVLAYWQQQREGWFWYREPRAHPKRQVASQPPKLLSEFEAMQQRLETLKRVAVMNPSDANLIAYMRYQRLVMDKSQAFADRWQKLVWQEPELDYSMNGRPTNALAIKAFDERQRERDSASVRQLAATHGLVFVFRSDCPFCHRFAPILRRFATEHGLTVLAVSLDGGTLPEYPEARPDNGIAARLNARTVPALYLTEPSRRDIRAVGFGLMSDSDLLERVAALGRTSEPRNEDGWRITP